MERDIREFYKEKIINAIADVVLEARQSAYYDGLKAGRRMETSKESASFDYDEEEPTAKVVGKNDSTQEYKSGINNDLGILGQ